MTHQTEHHASDEPANAERRALLQKSLLAGGAILGTGFALPAQAAGAALPDMVRLVVTGNTAGGKSHIASDEMIKRGDMWKTKAGDPLGPIAPTDTKVIQPANQPGGDLPDGGTVAYFFTINPSAGKFDRAAMNAKGWERSATIVYIFFVGGEVTYITDEQETTMRAGDVLVQRNANHAWHNATNGPATAFAVKIRV